MADTNRTLEESFYQVAGNPDLVATTDPVWNRRMKRWLLADGLQRADIEFGRNRTALDAYDLELERVVALYGKAWRTIPEVAAHMRVAFDQLSAADDIRIETYMEPLWAAGRELVATPAPTLAAMMFKIELVKRENLQDDMVLDAEMFDIVAEDAAKLMEAL